MKNTLYLALLYFMFTAIAAFVTKPANATLVLSDLNGIPVLYDAGRGFYILPVFNYGGLVFTGNPVERFLYAQTFASTIDYAGVLGWKVHRGSGNLGSDDNITFTPYDFTNFDLAYDIGLFGVHDGFDASDRWGVQGFASYVTDGFCGRYGMFDSTCTFATGNGTGNHAIYEIYASNFRFKNGPGSSAHVPEPLSLTLIGLGLLGLVLRRFKKQTI
jgi:hypothetical protein